MKRLLLLTVLFSISATALASQSTEEGIKDDPSISPFEKLDKPFKKKLAKPIRSAKGDYQRAMNLLLRNRDVEASAIALEQHVKSYPNSVYLSDAYYWLGMIYSQQDEKEVAIYSLEKMLTFDSQNRKRTKEAIKLLNELKSQD